MDVIKFNQLVDQLLEPKLKSHILLRERNPKLITDTHRDDSITLRPKAKPCGDCDKVVIGRVIFIEKRGMGTRNERWQKKCSECGLKTPLQNGLKDL